MNTTVPQNKPETDVPPLSASTSGPQPEEISAKTQAFFLNSHPGRLFLWMAIPGAVSMLASSLYVFLDGIFVGRLLGNEAFAALNFVFPLVILNFAIADLVGVGSSVPISIRSTLDRLVPEAGNMEIVYAVNAKNIWSGGFPAYLQDNSRKLAGKKVKSIGYFMYLVGANGGERFAYASMDPFTQEIAKLGVPTAAGKIFFQQTVRNLYVKSNVPGLSSGKFEDGNIEFWSGNYTQKNSANVPGASDQTFDFGDTGTSLHDGYGSFQLHNYRLKQTVFALNNFRAAAPDVGIGNNRQGNPDYTFSASSKDYAVATLLILAEVE